MIGNAKNETSFPHKSWLTSSIINSISISNSIVSISLSIRNYYYLQQHEQQMQEFIEKIIILGMTKVVAKKKREKKGESRTRSGKNW